MAGRANRDVEYVVVTDRRPKPVQRYHYDTDDDNDSQMAMTRIVRTKPIKDQRIKYVQVNNFDDDRRPRQNESINNHGIKIRYTNDGEQVILDDEDNILKIVRHQRTPSPPVVDNRRIIIRHREPRPVYYEMPDGQLVKTVLKHRNPTKKRTEYVYIDNEPKKIVRKVIVGAKPDEQEIFLEKDKLKKHLPKRITVRRHNDEIAYDSDDEYEQRPAEKSQYIEIIREQKPPKELVVKKEKEPTTKYVMIRKKINPEQEAAPTSNRAMPATRRIVYEEPAKKPPTKYVYETEEKHYK